MPYNRITRRFFFFQAEDGIRDKLVTGVQTCALPISRSLRRSRARGPRGSGGRAPLTRSVTTTGELRRATRSVILERGLHDAFGDRPETVIARLHRPS